MTNLRRYFQSNKTWKKIREEKTPFITFAEAPVKSPRLKRLETIILASLLCALSIITFSRTSWYHRRAPRVTGSAPVVPDYFQTTTELYPGPTATGTAPFLAQTNPAATVPNTPLVTGQIIAGASERNIFELMGNLSPYFPNPRYVGI